MSTSKNYFFFFVKQTRVVVSNCNLTKLKQHILAGLDSAQFSSVLTCVQWLLLLFYDIVRI